MPNESTSSGTRPRPREVRRLSLSHEPNAPPANPPHESDRKLLAMIMVVGIVRPVQAVIRGERWGPEAVVGLLMAILAARALLLEVVVRWSRSSATEPLHPRAQSLLGEPVGLPPNVEVEQDRSHDR